MEHMLKKITPENLTLSAFCAILLICLLLDLSVIWALLAGLVLFCAFAWKKGFGFGEIIRMIINGNRKSVNVLIILALIGMLTGIWRAGGTIAAIICWSAKLIKPEIFLLLAFLLNCGVSLLTGTSFGTAATMGSICMGLANAMGINPVLAGGACMSGIFFGDRCSPVSSSAMLVSEVTETDIYDNIRGMVKTSAVPFALCTAAFTIMGFFTKAVTAGTDLEAVFGREFNISLLCALPAAIILVFAILKIKVRITIITSIAAAIVTAAAVQHAGAASILKTLLTGFTASNPEVGAMLNGGGFTSMAKTLMIVMISSAYAGIFDRTDLLGSIQNLIEKLSGKITPFGGLLAASVFSSAIACNQTLATMLCAELCKKSIPDKQERAIALENSVILIAALIPWSICGAVPLATIGVPTRTLFFSFFIWSVPLWNLIKAFACKHRKESDNGIR